MAYEFKKLSDVAAVETPADTANVLIEEGGVIKKVAKKSVGETSDAIIGKIAAVDAVEEPSDTANVLIEDGGSLKRVPVGTVGGFKTAIIKDSNYDIVIGGGTADTENITYSCINMSYDEAKAVIDSGDVLNAIFMLFSDSCMTAPAWMVGFAPAVGCIILVMNTGANMIPFYWTADGISKTAPTTTTE